MGDLSNLIYVCDFIELYHVMHCEEVARMKILLLSSYTIDVDNHTINLSSRMFTLKNTRVHLTKYYQALIAYI